VNEQQKQALNIQTFVTGFGRSSSRVRRSVRARIR
jgi:hypothetical protein